MAKVFWIKYHESIITQSKLCLDAVGKTLSCTEKSIFHFIIFRFIFVNIFFRIIIAKFVTSEILLTYDARSLR